MSTMRPETASMADFRRLNLYRILPVVTAAGVLTVALDAQTWAQVLVLGAGVLAGVVGFVGWAVGRVLDVALPCLLVASLVWQYGVVVAGSGSAFFGLLMAGPLVVPELPRHRRAAAVGLVALVAMIGSTRLLVSDAALRGDLIGFVIVPAAITAIVVGWRFPNHGFYAVVNELEASRERDAELAVMRERVRFAGDLHDIQGHTLHVVKLKADLARKTLRSDVATAEHELREIHALVAETIDQTKALAYGQRRLNLQAEVANATNLLEAAGAEVTLSRDGDPDPGWSDALSQVLRETTTNILRHARAREVGIELGRAGLVVTNDGADAQQSPELRGLAGLRDRVADSGGTLEVEQTGATFRTAAVYTAAPAPAAAPAVEGGVAR